MKVRADPSVTIGDPHKYLLQRIKEYADKKDEVTFWNPVTLWYMAGTLKCTISDPKIMQDI